LVFALYAIIFLRIFLIIKKTNDLFGKLIASGVVGMLFFHFIVNIGMVMGFMPITGIPLLFLSYGGSSLWTAMIAVGLVIGISLRQL
jgi:rod shape-determining protein rodA